MCVSFICLIKFNQRVCIFPHTRQGYGFSSMCILVWLFKASFNSFIYMFGCSILILSSFTWTSRFLQIYFVYTLTFLIVSISWCHFSILAVKVIKLLFWFKNFFLLVFHFHHIRISLIIQFNIFCSTFFFFNLILV